MAKEKKQREFSSQTSDLSLNEFKKLFKCVPYFYWKIIGNTSLELLLLTLVFFIIYQCNIIEFIILYSALVLMIALIYKIKIDWLARKTYEEYIKMGLIDATATINFYQEYLEKVTKDSNVKLQYEQIARIVETEENFYILNPKNIININKKECDSKLIKFIERIDTVHKNNKEPQKNTNKITVKFKHIKILLLTVFLLTLFSIYGAIITVNIVTKDDISLLSIKKMWIFWLWLPIPITSIILGYKYKYTEIKCKKNIIAGFIVGSLLLIFGCFTFLLPVITKDYKIINDYKDILKVELPKKGILTQTHYDTMFDNDKMNFTITRAMYSPKDTRELESAISKSNYWEKISNIKSEMKALFPSQLQNISENNYFLIYNEDKDVYNSLPNIQGKYHIYIILYIPNEHTLEINDFNYNFIK